MIDHLTLSVRDFALSRAFYLKVFEPLGYWVKREFPNICGFGDPNPYHPHYYGAFVIDPDGHPIEAVCHSPID